MRAHIHSFIKTDALDIKDTKALNEKTKMIIYNKLINY